MMWREGGAAIGYVYLPLSVAGTNNTDSLMAWKVQGKDYRRVSEPTGRTGENVFCKTDGGMEFVAGTWNNVSMLVALGVPGEYNGVLSFKVNGNQRSTADVLFRTAANISITDLIFVSFFGGGNSSWAASADTFAQFKDFTFSTNPNVSEFRAQQ